MDSIAFDPRWWVTAVELPVLGAMAMMVWRVRH